MPWLIRDGDVLAAIEDRRKGWRSSLSGALVLGPPAVPHTLIGGAALDVAWCGPATLDGGVTGYRVRRTRCLEPRRLARPHLGPGVVVVAPLGTFERWHLHIGDCLEVRGG